MTLQEDLLLDYKTTSDNASEDYVFCCRYFEVDHVKDFCMSYVSYWFDRITKPAQPLYIRRDAAEKNTHYKQVIPFVLIFRNQKILRYRRKRNRKQASRALFSRCWRPYNESRRQLSRGDVQGSAGRDRLGACPSGPCGIHQRQLDGSRQSPFWHCPYNGAAAWRHHGR